MINVVENAPADASALAAVVRESLDRLASYATYLVGDPRKAMGYVAGGIDRWRKYPPARIQADGEVALYRAVTRACKQQYQFPPRNHGPSRFFKRQQPAFEAELASDSASRMNTVKRALMSVNMERRAAILLHDFAHLNYEQMGVALECSPEQAGRLLAGARRDFGSIYREIAI
jgi:DNA-directed RNA polymerase specialized sigma24 family protein